jgi:hypothetical protein
MAPLNNALVTSAVNVSRWVLVLGVKGLVRELSEG